jgi:uncharacterized protein YdhG (YjbR/CyaY superfamily)
MPARSLTSVDGYLARTPQPHRKTLAALRLTLRRVLPRAEEGISYGMPCFKVDGKGVACFAAFTSHCTYFPMSGTVLGALERDVAAYAVSKGGLRFAPDAPLPRKLVEKLVKARLQELSRPPAKGTGPFRAYYDDGALQSKGAYKAGKMHGKWAFYRRDGSVMRTGEFRLGAQVGTWRTWDRKGRVVKETEF